MATKRRRRRGLRRMRHIITDEVSLVEEPATFRSFYVVKGKGTKMDAKMVEALIDLCGDDTPEDFEETLEKVELPKKVAKSMKSALNTLGKYLEEFPDEVQKAIGVMAEAAGLGFARTTERKVTKVRLSKQDQGTLEEILDQLGRITKSHKVLKALLNAKGKIKKSRKRADDDDDGENTISLTRDGLNDLLDGVITQTLEGVGLVNKSDGSHIGRGKEDRDDPFTSTAVLDRDEEDEEDEEEIEEDPKEDIEDFYEDAEDEDEDENDEEFEDEE